ncbi:histone-like nucleoid-structuring protein Lsr2, partial [Mycobacteroides abscessus]
MATVSRLEVVDDIDKEQLADETVEFGLDGFDYEIDLSAANAQLLRTDLNRWIAAARPGKRRNRARFVPRGDVRAWARENGYTVPDTGRLPKDLLAAYDKA